MKRTTIPYATWLHSAFRPEMRIKAICRTIRKVRLKTEDLNNKYIAKA